MVKRASRRAPTSTKTTSTPTLTTITTSVGRPLFARTARRRWRRRRTLPALRRSRRRRRRRRARRRRARRRRNAGRTRTPTTTVWSSDARTSTRRRTGRATIEVKYASLELAREACDSVPSCDAINYKDNQQTCFKECGGSPDYKKDNYGGRFIASVRSECKPAVPPSPPPPSPPPPPSAADAVAAAAAARRRRRRRRRRARRRRRRRRPRFRRARRSTRRTSATGSDEHSVYGDAGMCKDQANAEKRCARAGETLATIYSQTEETLAKEAVQDGHAGEHHWLGGYIGDDDAGGDDSCTTTAGMYAYWKEKVCTDDSCTTTDEKVSRDATQPAAAPRGPRLSACQLPGSGVHYGRRRQRYQSTGLHQTRRTDPFVDIKGLIENGAMKWYCLCDKQSNQLDRRPARRDRVRAAPSRMRRQVAVSLQQPAGVRAVSETGSGGVGSTCSSSLRSAQTGEGRRDERRDARIEGRGRGETLVHIHSLHGVQ